MALVHGCNSNLLITLGPGSSGSKWLWCLAVIQACWWCLSLTIQKVSGSAASLQFSLTNYAYPYLFPDHTHPGPFSLYVCALFFTCWYIHLYFHRWSVFSICLSSKSLTSWIDKAYYLTSCHSKCGILNLFTSFIFSDLWYYLSKLIINKSGHLHLMLSMLYFHL